MCQICYSSVQKKLLWLFPKLLQLNVHIQDNSRSQEIHSTMTNNKTSNLSLSSILFQFPSGGRYTNNLTLTPWCAWCFIDYKWSITLCTVDGGGKWNAAAAWASWLALRGQDQTSVCPAGWIASGCRPNLLKFSQFFSESACTSLQITFLTNLIGIIY